MPTMQDPNLRHAVDLLPGPLRAAFTAGAETAAIEEIRLRTGRCVAVSYAGGERLLPGTAPVTAQHLLQVLEAATRSSLHTAAGSLRQGYVTTSGGCRVGVCGTAAVTAGEIGSLREISSLCIRVARAQPGAALPLLDKLLTGRICCNTLIVSPPGVGKTTLLRDLIRLLSERGLRVAVADERGEIAAMHGGVPRFDVGPHTDVLTGAPKVSTVMTLLRTMTPQVIALDEISEAEDARAVELAANCGTAILATVHGSGWSDVCMRPVFAEIAARGIFQRVVTVQLVEGCRQFSVEEV